MSKRLPSTAAVLAAISLSGACLADQPSLPASFQEIDANKDGAVSEAEYVAHAVAVAKAEFKQIDRDGSGALQAGEVTPGTVARTGLLRRGFSGDEEQRQGLQKRISPGPSMRQGGR